MKKNFYRTDYLFPRPSLWYGIGSILSLFRPFFEFNYSHSDEEADRNAIESDFGTVGEDIRKTMLSYEFWKKR